MAVDTALKRKAATCFLIPHISGAYPQGEAGIGPALRMAATWVYPVMATHGPATTDHTSAKPGTEFSGAGADTKSSAKATGQAFVSGQTKPKFSSGGIKTTFT